MAPNYTRINRNQVPWNFRLVFSLANNLRYQEAIQDIQHMFRPAETALLKIQPDVDRTAAEVATKYGAKGIERFLNSYAEHCLTQVGYAYHELVDYLMFRYLVDHWEVAPPNLPVIGAPFIPATSEGGWFEMTSEKTEQGLDKEFK